MLKAAIAAVVLLAAALAVVPRLYEDFDDRSRLEEELRVSKDHFVCAGYGLIDLGAALDAPSFYFREDSRTLVSVCGGACMRGACTLCPPPGWNAAGCEDQYLAWMERKRR